MGFMNKQSTNKSLMIVLLVSICILAGVFCVAFLSSHSEENHMEGMPTNTPIATPTPVDTLAPVVTTKKVVCGFGTEVSPEMFIDHIAEESEYTVHFQSEPNMETYGLQEVSLLVTDAAGNKTIAAAVLNVINLIERMDSHLGNSLPTAEAFLATEGSEISYVTNIQLIDVNQMGEHEIEFLVDGDLATAILRITDLKAPEVEVKESETWLNKPLESEFFVTEVKDDTEVTIYFYEEPKWDTEGEQEILIVASDAMGNVTKKPAKLIIKRDTKAPTLTVTDIDVEVGGTVAYKKAMVYYDNIDERSEMKVSIERSQVDLNTVGSYEVTYSVTDCSGNMTTVVGKVNVMAEAPKWADEDAIHEKADGILDTILKDDMTDRQKAKAIYRWLKNNIGYVSHSEKGNYMRGAYEGLFKQQGDCFVYAASAKELLTRAGIQNIDIVKATTNPSHYWTLVYIEDGWYHFDATPRKDKSEFFLLTDAELEAYSSTHKNTHIFDRSLYPEIK